MKKWVLFSIVLAGCAAEPRLTHDPSTGIFSDRETGECFVLIGSGVAAATIDVPCGR